jgi:hypothetical protein
VGSDFDHPPLSIHHLQQRPAADTMQEHFAQIGNKLGDDGYETL